MLQDLLQGFKELVFPDNCFLCRKYLQSSHQKQLCSSCLSSISYNTAPFCLKCSRHLTIFNEQGLCLTCLKTNYAFDAAWSACLYEKPLPDLLHAFKYFGKTSLRKTFTRMMLNFIETYHIPLHDFDWVIPIPLHPTRFRERGFNQAELLSSEIAQHLNRPHHPHLLMRVQLTPSQTTQDAKQRFTNVQDAFRINPSLNIADKNILIVDDLLTTAATVNSASLALKAAGAAQIGVLTLAITP